VDYNPKLQDDEVSDYHCATNSLRLKLLALNLHWLVAFPSLDDFLAAVLGSIDPVEKSICPLLDGQNRESLLKVED